MTITADINSGKLIKHRYIVFQGTDRKGDYVMYEPTDREPNGSRILADEIDGMNPSRAMRTLKSMYSTVTKFPSGVIICRP